MIKVIIGLILFALVIREIIIRDGKSIKHKSFEDIKYGHNINKNRHSN